MEVNKAVSVGTKRVGILLVNDDLICKNIVEEMLQHCSYQVLQIGGVFDVLHAIWEAKDRLYLLLTNAQKLVSNGDEILQHIHKKLNLRVKRMVPHDRMFESKGESFSFASYILNDLCEKDVESLWNFAFDKEKDKMLAAYREKNVQRASVSGVAGETNKADSSTSDADQNRKRVEDEEKSESSKEEQLKGKKRRVNWTNEMHERFLQALINLGPKDSVPKKIVAIMGDPDLTRENVASHLQKFRNSMKQTGETIFSSLPGKNTRKELDKLSSFSATRLNSSPYISTATQSISPYQSQYLNTRKDLSFGATFERQNSTSIKTYGDQNHQTRDIPSSSNANQPTINKFVGFRFSSDGKSIEHGPIDANISTEALVTTSMTPPNQTISCMQNRAILHADTEVWDEDTCIQSTTATDTAAAQNRPENDQTVQNASTSSSAFDHNQEMHTSPLDAFESNLENPGALTGRISEQNYSPSAFIYCNDRMEGIEITADQFDLDDFNDILFSEDD